MMAETLTVAMVPATRALNRTTPTMARQRLQGLLGGLLAATGALAWTQSAQSQDLVGCQLADGTLQCVPGLTASPQQQIQIMRREISTDIQLEGAVQQQINGLQALVLKGQAIEGGLLAATVTADALAALPPLAYHWYRLTPGQTRWQLIQGATGATYGVTAADVGQRILVVVVVQRGDGTSQRVSSPATDPVRSRSSLQP